MRGYHGGWFSFALAVGLCAAASAAPVKVVLVQDLFSDSRNTGGPFTATLGELNGSTFTATAAPFETFCLESGEYFNPGNYYKYDIATWAINGLPNDTSPPDPTKSKIVGGVQVDPLDDESAWIYCQFRTNKGALKSTVASLAAANSIAFDGSNDKDFYWGIQEAIWYLESSGPPTSKPSGQGKQLGWALARWMLAGTNVSSADLAFAQSMVDVLNLYDRSNGAVKQSQLILVPLPGAAWAGAALLAGLIVVRARRRA